MAKAVPRTQTYPSTSPVTDVPGIQVGRALLNSRPAPVAGKVVRRDGDTWYRIRHFDQLPPFLVTLASAGDQWMFISSTGALTAGRCTSDQALFPYVTDDKLHSAASHTGSRTLILVERARERLLWEPFSQRYAGIYTVERNLYKNALGTCLLFEETNRELSLRFSYRWQAIHAVGFVRTVRIESLWQYPIRLRVLDGLLNLLPSGVPSTLQNTRSTLVDAYKTASLEGEVATYSLSSLIVDRPEPAESLRATLAWSHTPHGPISVLLSDLQVDRFRTGAPLHSERRVHGRRGAYLVEQSLRLTQGEPCEWTIAAEVDQDPAGLARAQALCAESQSSTTYLRDAASRDATTLCNLVAGHDGFQRTANPVQDLRHTANVLYNFMRGGTPVQDYRTTRNDLIAFVRERNKCLGDAPYLHALPSEVDLQRLPECSNPQLRRLLLTYLPFGYSRRHGDPSRPWNAFTIHTHDADGNLKLDYSGNWRDLFQNWEALACSYPGFLAGMIATFANASTADGYNPYRIGRSGIDWEVPDPTDPWAHIGYWGDHQIIYLLRLLELAHMHEPGELSALLVKRCFSYANVPYRLHSFEDTLADPGRSITFDAELDRAIGERVSSMGTDGRLILDANEQVLMVTLAEKLLVPVLAKLSAYVPGAGIWMHTQRPEWNDANNALAGWGCSLVTLYHLHRYLTYLARLTSAQERTEVAVSEEIVQWMARIQAALATPCDNRLAIMRQVGEAGADYRRGLYESGLSGHHQPLSFAEISRFCSAAAHAIASTLSGAERRDGLVHAYTMLRRTEDDSIQVEPLDLMLEGQVAALDSGILPAETAVRLLDALRSSSLYRKDQHTYLLYPTRRLRSFGAFNRIAPNHMARLIPVRKMVAQGDTRLMGRTANGSYFFNPDLINREHLESALSAVIAGRVPGIDRIRDRLLALYDEVFGHSSYTGRSGRFYKYEGLGCVYWHMVSKLLLAVQRTFWDAVDQGASYGVRTALARHYYDIRAGLGGDKSPAEFGAFPQDAYSHTPHHMGAQQPGLTGQVKEDLVARWGELGVRVRSGAVSFNPALLRKSEFCKSTAVLDWHDVSCTRQTMKLKPGTIAFTYCQVPVVYTQSKQPELRIHGESTTARSNLELTCKETESILRRTGEIRQLDVHLSPAL